MLAHDGVVLFKFSTLARINFVLARDISEASVSGAAKFDDRTFVFTFGCHDCYSDFLSGASHFGDD